MNLVRLATVAALIAGLWAAAYFGDSAVEEAAHWLEPSAPVPLYFAAPDAAGVAAEIRWLPERRRTPAGLIAELAAGPRDARLSPSLPGSTRVRTAVVRDGTAVLDFDGAIQRDHPGGSAGELITVYAIVNTLTEIEGIERVMFLIEGRTVESLAGHMDLRWPIERDESFIVTHLF